ncbi:latrophilin Cirl [Daktulosphaira vitifoliae]|uniref:latrophilin Cirl n=1 Tax=Daktulosphaira vitifoliae TaxID=58002 RepID=UPI0021AA062B|nr:latrophilin Cirl [Daktulosphaira vitifoliae]
MARLKITNVQSVFFLLNVLFSVILAKDVNRYDTVYACEGKPLKLECREGEIIHLDRAIYGRYSITVCNDHGNTDWSVNCMSTNTLPLLQAKCNEKRNCSIQANTSLFSDPCPGTMKYLEAQYHCIPASLSTTTLKPNPPWLITSQPSVWNADKLLTLKPATPIPPILSSPQLDDTAGSSVEEHISSVSLTTTSTVATSELFISHKENNSITEGEQNLPSVAITTEWNVPPPTSDLPPQLSIIDVEGMDDRLSLSCPPETSRSLFWNWTKAGEEAVQACPGGAAGVARWRCQSLIAGIPIRIPPTPDLSECRSVWLSSLEGRLHQGDSIISIANDLSQVTDSKPLYGGDMMTTTKMLRDLAQKMEKDMVTFPDKQQQEAMVTDLLQCVVRIGSNLLNVSQYSSWRDLAFNEQMRVATNLLVGLEENSFLLADIMMKEKTITHSVKNIYLSVRVISTQNVDTEVFPPLYTSNNGIFMNNTWLQLQKSALLENSEAGFIRLVYIAFDSLENILQPQSSNGIRIINSKIISASLGKGKHIQLHQPVTLCFQHLQIDNVSNPTCVFWDYTENGWSEEGCSVIYTNQTHTLCQCNHLTNFAILMDLKNSGEMPITFSTNKLLLYVSCIFSGVCFLLAAITLQLTVKSNRTVILKNLFLCLFLVECFFLFEVTQERTVFVCSVIAVILQILLLCSFMWTFIEGFHLYATLIEAFNSEKLQMRLYYLVAYGIPLSIVIAACYLDPYVYNSNNCLKPNNIIVYSIIFIVSVNLVLLCLSLYIIRSNSSLMSIKCKENVKITSLKMWLRSAILLLIFIMLTWTLAFFYITSYSIFMLYIFSVVNCSQGLLIVLLYCIKNNSVYKVFSELNMISFLPWQCCLINSTQEMNLNYKNQRTSLYGTSVGPNSQGSIAECSTPRSLSSHRMNTFHHPVHERHTLGSKIINIQNEIEVPDLDNTIPKNEHQAVVCGGTLPYTRSSQKTYSRNKMLPKAGTMFGSRLHKQSLQSKPSIQDKCFSLKQPTYVHNNHGVPKICSIRCNTLGDGFIDNNCSTKKYIGVSGVRATSPWNHTYSEIMGGISASGGGLEDPVYEEIEREREREREQAALVSDLSDEDGRRNSDMSRQSSRSYGDHRPLIMAPPQSPDTQDFHTALNAAFRQQLKEQTARTIAVLDGQTVVCHLQPDHNDSYAQQQTVQHYSYEC